jgi:DNA polymerase-1
MNFDNIIQSIEENKNKNRKNKIIILDGLNLFIRVFTASPLMDQHGKHVGGCAGFLKTLAMLIRRFGPNRVIVTFDGQNGSQRRRKLYSDYKGNRAVSQRFNRAYDFLSIEEEKESMRDQMMTLIRILDTLPVDIITIDNIEADDSIAYCTELFKEENEIVIISSDKDYLQLINENVTVYNPVKKIHYTPKEVVDEFQIPPHNFLTYRILTGDNSDNVPGIKGIGVKTLIKEFPEILNDTLHYTDLHKLATEKDSKKKTIQLIKENLDILERNYHLMQLHSVNISGHAKLLIQDILNRPKNKVNKMFLVQKMAQERVLEVFDKDINTFIKVFNNL